MSDLSLRPLDICSDPVPLPSPERIQAIAADLSRSWRCAVLQRTDLRIERAIDGRFIVQRLKESGRPKRTYYNTGYAHGSLADAMASSAIGYGFMIDEADLGLPVDERAKTVVITMLIDFFRAAQAAGVAASYHFRPWVGAHLRHRTVFYAADLDRRGYRREIVFRSASARDALMAGCQFLSTLDY